MANIACTSPPHWRQAPAFGSGARVAAQDVEVELTLNGQDYLAALPHTNSFSYYPLNAPPYGISVASLSPRGGPTSGGTLVVLRGTGLVDRGGLWCKFEGEPLVAATAQDADHIHCTSPPLTTLPPGDVSANRSVEVTLNGQLHALTSAAIPFEYYTAGSLRVSDIYPRGGPGDGGAVVTVWGTGFKDLDGGQGLHCAFGSSALVRATMRTAEAAEQSLTCLSPPCTAGDDTCDSVAVRVTLNGNNPADTAGTARSQPCCSPSAADVLYSYYDTHDGVNVGAS